MRTLETERLILRDWRETDLDDMFICLSNPKFRYRKGRLHAKHQKSAKRYWII